MAVENEDLNVAQTARIAVYDDFLSPPRVVEIAPTDINSYIEQIASKTYELSTAIGGNVPYTVIREVSENFIHAHFREPVVSIMDKGKTIRFADQGPGIENKERAQLPGFTSATAEMKDYIRGVGSGLPTVREYLKFSNGRLMIEDNIKAGTVITIMMNEDKPNEMPVVYKEDTRANKPKVVHADDLTDREFGALSLAAEQEEVGPTVLQEHLGIPIASGYRVLTKLENLGLIQKDLESRKHTITELGYQVLKGQE